MADLLTLARPYAKAAFMHASEAKVLDTWSPALKLAAQVVQDNTFADYLLRPELTQTEKTQALVKALGGQVSSDVANFMQLLSDNHRLQLLPQISDEFEELRARELNETNVVVETAFELDDAQKQLLSEKLAKRFNARINLSTVVNPDLIAGVIIRAGDQVIDDSARGKLEKMRTKLTV